MYYRKRWGDVSGLGNPATENGLRRSNGMSPSAKQQKASEGDFLQIYPGKRRLSRC